MISTKMITLSEHRFNYLLVFILVALSGIPFFYKDPLMRPTLLITFIVVSITFLNKKHKLDKFILIYIYVFFMISLGQFFIFEAIPIVTTVGYIIRILLAYLILKITGRFFINYYINILYFFCLISLCFYLPTLISPKFEYYCINNITPFFNLPQAEDAFYKITPNLIIFNFNSTLDNPLSFGIRNSGPFWEPGAFGGFTIIAMIFNLIKTGKLFNKKNVVFAIAIATTLSTSVIIAFFVLVILYYLQLNKTSTKYFIVPALIVSAVFSYYQFTFLGEKIDKNTKSISTSNTSNRFVSALTDIEDIEEYWIFGRGINEETRFDDSENDFMDMHRNNGVTALLVNVGLIGGILYFSLIAKSFKVLCAQANLPSSFLLPIMLVVLIIGFSEGYFTKVFFISLTMLHISFPHKPIRESSSIATNA